MYTEDALGNAKVFLNLARQTGRATRGGQLVFDVEKDEEEEGI